MSGLEEATTTTTASDRAERAAAGGRDGSNVDKDGAEESGAEADGERRSGVGVVNVDVDDEILPATSVSVLLVVAVQMLLLLLVPVETEAVKMGGSAKPVRHWPRDVAGASGSSTKRAATMATTSDSTATAARVTVSSRFRLGRSLAEEVPRKMPMIGLGEIMAVKKERGKKRVK